MKTTPKMATKPAYILDNGAYSLKVGHSNQKPKTVPNAIMKAKSERRRPFIGDQIEDCRDASGLFFILPFQKGYLINWDIQKTIWDYTFSKECCPVNFSDTPLIFTEPFFNFTPVQEGINEIFFEEYDCKSLLRINAPDLSSYKYRIERPQELCCVIVDAGYSFTHIIPYVNGKKVKEAIRRIEVGGKLLTNHLKDIISYRQLHVMDETYVMNQAKEDLCYVSDNFMEDMAIASKRGEQNTILRDYVLPDFTTIRRGFIRTPKESQEAAEKKEQCQLLHLNNERFAVPELLFHPSDIGIQQKGVTEALYEAVWACPEDTRPHLLRNIMLTGGCSIFPGFCMRVSSELRKITPIEMPIKVTLPKNPMMYAWEGGSMLSQDNALLNTKSVSKEDYEEHGHKICFETFDI
ncbi:hypothetical protein B566_EDAN014041 [Ephemera danica]|nr:hypothetical protein B566_EDAN014041 [Ephemera danica]